MWWQGVLVVVEVVVVEERKKLCLTLDQRFECVHARNHAHAQIVVYINCTVL